MAGSFPKHETLLQIKKKMYTDGFCVAFRSLYSWKITEWAGTAQRTFYNSRSFSSEDSEAAFRNWAGRCFSFTHVKEVTHSFEPFLQGHVEKKRRTEMLHDCPTSTESTECSKHWKNRDVNHMRHVPNITARSCLWDLGCMSTWTLNFPCCHMCNLDNVKIKKK